MLRVYPLRGEEEAAYRKNNDVSPETVVFCADDGQSVSYPTLHRSEGDVILTAFTGDEVMDEMFIRAAASYGEYRGDEMLVCKAECSQALLARMGFSSENGKCVLAINRVIHYDN